MLASNAAVCCCGPTTTMVEGHCVAGCRSRCRRGSKCAWVGERRPASGPTRRGRDTQTERDTREKEGEEVKEARPTAADVVPVVSPVVCLVCVGSCSTAAESRAARATRATRATLPIPRRTSGDESTREREGGRCRGGGATHEDGRRALRVCHGASTRADAGEATFKLSRCSALPTHHCLTHSPLPPFFLPQSCLVSFLSGRTLPVDPVGGGDVPSSSASSSSSPSLGGRPTWPHSIVSRLDVDQLAPLRRLDEWGDTLPLCGDGQPAKVRVCATVRLCLEAASIGRSHRSDSFEIACALSHLPHTPRGPLLPPHARVRSRALPLLSGGCAARAVGAAESPPLRA